MVVRVTAVLEKLKVAEGVMVVQGTAVEDGRCNDKRNSGVWWMMAHPTPHHSVFREKHLKYGATAASLR